MKSLGYKLNENEMNSGNVKIIFKDAKIVCVFVLAKRGNLLAQLTRDPLEQNIETRIADLLVEELNKDSKQNSIKIQGNKINN